MKRFFSSTVFNRGLYKNYLDKVRPNVREISCKDLHKMLGQSDVKVIDVREPVETEDKLPTAIYIGKGLLESKIEQYADVNDTVVLYCAGGFRSLLAADGLQKMGYKNVYSLDGILL